MTELKEEWKDIKGYPNYQVSNMGRVKSLERNVVRGRGGLYKIEEKILKSVKNNGGYFSVSLSKENKSKYFSVHRLVASAFLPNPDNLPQVNHINEIKTDNRVENLEWCDRSYNINFGTRNKRASASCQKPILQVTKQGKIIHKWNSVREVERELGFNRSNIIKCCKGKLKLAYGYVWKYKDVNDCKLCA